MPKGQGLTKPMKLSAELAEVVGKKEASRAECIKQLWAYLKKNNLQVTNTSVFPLVFLQKRFSGSFPEY